MGRRAKVCAGVGHEALSVFVYYCQHEQRWHVWWSGGTCEEPTESVELVYGPFDDAADVWVDVGRLLSAVQARAER